MDINEIWGEDDYGDPEDLLTKEIQENPSESGIRHLAKAHEALVKMTEAYFEARYEADSEWRKQANFIGTPNIQSIKFDYWTREAKIECSCRACTRGCCGTDYHTFRFPLEYLWLDQTAILEDMKAKAEEAKRAAQLAKEAQLAQERKRQEETERKQFLDLQAKYGAKS